MGDFNLVSTSSNLKGRTGGVREGGREGRHYRHGPEPEPGEISSELENPEHNDSERERETEREGGKQTGKREIMCRLIGPGASRGRASHVTRAGAGDSSLVTHARADTGAETGLPGCPDPRKLEIK